MSIPDPEPYSTGWGVFLALWIIADWAWYEALGVAVAFGVVTWVINLMADALIDSVRERRSRADG